MTATVIEQYSWNVNITKGGTPVSPDFPRVYGIRQPNLAAGDAVINQLVNASGVFASDLDVTAAEISVTGDISTITDRNPYEIRFLSYGNRFIVFNKNFSAPSVDFGFLETDTVITETTKATVLAYPGYTLDQTIELLSGTWNPQRVYDRTIAEAVDTPNRQRAAAISSVDGVNFQIELAFIIRNIPYNGGGAIYTPPSTIIASGVGLDLSNLTINDVFLQDTSQTDFTSFNVTSEFDLFGDTPGPTVYNLTDSIVEAVSTDEGQPITVNLLGTSTVTTNIDPADITIVNAKSITVRALDQVTQLPIENARIFLEELIGGADIIAPATLTDANGEVTVTYNLIGPSVDAVGFARKGSESPTYKAAPITVEITGDTLIVVSLTPDGA